MPAVGKPKNVNRRFVDTCALTPYEQKLWDFASQGMKPKEIAEAIGAKNVSSIAPRMKIIKEKLEAASY